MGEGRGEREGVGHLAPIPHPMGSTPGEKEKLPQKGVPPEE